MSAPAILQFGTGRLLQAHVDLMVGEALGRGEAIGTIALYVPVPQKDESTGWKIPWPGCW